MIVATRGLGKRYGTTVALDGVDLEVPRGVVYGLVGPNGAGKTTLLAILAGLRRQSSGSVHLDVPPERIAALPDLAQFEPWLTAREVVELSRRLVCGDAPPAVLDAALEAAGLMEAADRRTGGFSRGMLQRLGLAASIVTEPELLILDEPAAALDPQGRRDVLDLMARLGRDRTVLFSSHILADVERICDVVGVLDRGRLVYQGPMGALLVGRATPAYVVRLVPPAEGVATALRAEPWVSAVEELDPLQLRLTVRSMDDAHAQLASALSRAGARIVSVEPDAPDLESVFLELTRT